MVQLGFIIFIYDLSQILTGMYIRYDWIHWVSIEYVGIRIPYELEHKLLTFN